MIKIARTVNAEGVASYVETNATFVDSVVDTLTLPLDSFKKDDDAEFISRKSAGISVLGALLGGMELGDRFNMSVGRMVSGLS